MAVRYGRGCWSGVYWRAFVCILPGVGQYGSVDPSPSSLLLIIVCGTIRVGACSFELIVDVKSALETTVRVLFFFKNTKLEKIARPSLQRSCLQCIIFSLSSSGVVLMVGA